MPACTRRVAYRPRRLFQNVHPLLCPSLNPASSRNPRNSRATAPTCWPCWPRSQSLQQRTRDRSAQSRPLFDKRGQLLPRERIALLLDAGSDFLELSALAGYGMDHPDLAKCIPGAGVITGIGTVAGTRCMVVASDSGIEAGSIRAMGLEKMLRAQQLALDNKLPFVHLVESAGANLLRYKVEGFVHGGAIFRNLARLSAAGLPVVTVVHGSSTAGGAYMPGLSDYVIMVRGRARAFLAGPPLLKAATGEIATEEELGGAEMHTSVSGLGEYMAEDDADGVRLAREVVQRLHWQPASGAGRPSGAAARRLPPRLDPQELLGIMSADGRKPCRHARGDRAHRRRLGLPGVQGPVRPGHRDRPRQHLRPPGGHHQQQRPARPGRRQQGDPLHPGLLPERHRRWSTCRTPPATWWARTTNAAA